MRPLPFVAGTGTAAIVPGKLMLVGEYAVLEGAPALVAAVDRWARVEVRPAAGFSVRAVGAGAPGGRRAFSLDAAGSPRFADPAAGGSLAPFAAAVAGVSGWAREAGVPLAPARISVDTRAFVAADGTKLGLGSSAAVVVGVMAALAAHAGLLGPRPLVEAGARPALLARAHAAHAAAQGGRGSGADIAAATLGGVVRVQRRADSPAAFDMARPVPAVWAALWAGRPASTPDLIAKVASLKAGDAATYWRILERLGVLSQAGCEFWSLGETTAFLSVVEGLHQALAELGAAAGADIVTAAHADLHALVRAHGGVYKVSGAGGGDLGVAFCRHRLGRWRLARALARRGHAPVSLAPTPHGVMVGGLERPFAPGKVDVD